MACLNLLSHNASGLVFLCMGLIVPKKGGTLQRSDVVFVSPTGEEIKTKRQLDQYLKSHPGGPTASEFDWAAGNTPRRSARLSEKSKAVETTAIQSPAKKQKRSATKRGAANEKSNTDNAEGEATADGDNAADDKPKENPDTEIPEANKEPKENLDAEIPEANTEPKENPDAEIPEANTEPKESPDAEIPEANREPKEGPDAEIPEANREPKENPDAEIPEANTEPKENPDAEIPEANREPKENPDAEILEANREPKINPDAEIPEANKEKENPDTEISEANEEFKENLDAEILEVKDPVQGEPAVTDQTLPEKPNVEQKAAETDPPTDDARTNAKPNLPTDYMHSIAKESNDATNTDAKINDSNNMLNIEEAKETILSTQNHESDDAVRAEKETPVETREKQVDNNNDKGWEFPEPRTGN